VNSDKTAPRRADAGLLSSARAFTLPVGPCIEPGRVRGYYIDMRVKAQSPLPPSAEDDLHVITIQRALGSYERYLAGEGDAWLDHALTVGRQLVRNQERGGRHDGGWLHRRPFGHTFQVRPPWLSGMAQGEGSSLLVRLYGETGDEQLAEGARRALRPLSVPTTDGGVAAMLEGRRLPEEYPTDPPSFVLNGAIFALWGCYDVGIGLDDRDALALFDEGLSTLAASIDRWDTGYWSRYDLFPHRVVNVASGAYHALHINQLRALQMISARSQLQRALERFERYTGRRRNRYLAFAAKVLFRLVVPRSAGLARVLPWSRSY
jgi:hypothetical protein